MLKAGSMFHGKLQTLKATDRAGVRPYYTYLPCRGHFKLDYVSTCFKYCSLFDHMVEHLLDNIDHVTLTIKANILLDYVTGTAETGHNC